MHPHLMPLSPLSPACDKYSMYILFTPDRKHGVDSEDIIEVFSASQIY